MSTGKTGPMQSISHVEIDSKIQEYLNEIKELTCGFKGGEIISCPRCSTQYQVQPINLGEDIKHKELNRHLWDKSNELLNFFKEEGECPHCHGSTFENTMTGYTRYTFEINSTLNIEALRLPLKSFRKPRVLNGKWLDAKPRSKKPKCGKTPEIQKLN